MNAPEFPLNDPTQVLRHARWLSALARRLVRDEAAAEDLVQETLARYMERPPQDPRATGSWLGRVLRNLAARSHRSAARRERREILSARPESGGEGAEEVVARAEELQRISRIVLELEEPYRSTLLLHFFEEIPAPEIARKAGISPNTVSTRIRRALELVRERLDRAHGGKRAQWLMLLVPMVAAGGWPAAAAAAGGTGASSAAASAAGPLTVPTIGAGGSTAATFSAAATRGVAAVLGKLTLGGLPLASKKLGIAALLSGLLILGVVGIVLQGRRGDPRTGDPAANSSAGTILVDSARPRETRATATGSTEPRAGGTDLRTPALRDRAGVRGRVLAAGGQPIAGATVIALPLPGWDEVVRLEREPLAARSSGDVGGPLAAALERLREHALTLPSTTTAEDGTFLLEGVEDGDHRLAALAAGFLPEADTVVLVSGRRAEGGDIELAAALEVSGRTLDELGQPLPGVHVDAILSSWRLAGARFTPEDLESFLEPEVVLAGTATTMSDRGGKFTVGGLPPGRVDLHARLEGRPAAQALDVPAGGDPVEVVLPRGNLVRGRVVGPERRPLPGATVILAPRHPSREAASFVGQLHGNTLQVDAFLGGGTASRTATTGKDGAFELTGAATGPHEITVGLEAFTRLSRQVLVEGDVDLGELLLARGGKADGIVVAPDGAPVQGAVVRVERTEREGIQTWGGLLEPPTTIAEVVTGPAGTFHLDGLPGGTILLHVAARDWVPASVPLEPGDDGRLHDARSAGETPGGPLTIALAAGATLTGTVLESGSGRAVEGARVSLVEGLAGHEVLAKVTSSGPGGAFTLRGVDLGAEHLKVAAVSPDDPEVKARVFLGPGVHSVKLELEPSVVLHGQVLDGSGQPAPRARVTCSVPNVLAARTAEDGSFQLSIPAGWTRGAWFEVTAGSPREGWARVEVATERNSGRLPRLTLKLAPGLELRGSLRDTSGGALARGEVSLQRLVAGNRGQGRSEVAYSAADGSFRFRGLEAASYHLVARAPGFAEVTREPVEVARETVALELVLERGQDVSGRVVDETGAPVPGADVVTLLALDLDTSEDRGTEPTRTLRRLSERGIAAAHTGLDGRFRLGALPRSPLSLVARARGHAVSDLTPVDVEQPPGAAGAHVEILVPRLGRLEGRVLDTVTSAAIPSFTIWLRRLEGGDVRGMNLNLTVMPRSFVSTDGSFAYEGLPPGRFAMVLVAERRPVHFEEVEVAGGNSTSLLVHLPRGRRVAGKVVDRESGEPVPSAQVFVRTQLTWESTVPVGTPYTAFTAGDGTFVIDGVEGQKITVEAFHPGFTRKTQGLDLGESGEVPPVELRLRPAGSFEGKIANVLGRQCLWRWLELTPLEDSTREPTRHMLDNAREEFHFEGIRAGRYTISLGEDRLRPGLPAEQTSFGREEMETVELPLGEISIEPRQTTRFEAIAPPEPARRQ